MHLSSGVMVQMEQFNSDYDPPASDSRLEKDELVSCRRIIFSNIHLIDQDVTYVMRLLQLCSL